MPNALVVTMAGTNCDRELLAAFEMAGASAQPVHLKRLLERPQLIDRYDLIGLPGGFSFGDAVAAGRIAAALMREQLYPKLVGAIERGVPIIAPCNGFQIAVQIGLLPGPVVGQPWPARAPAASVTLGPNAGGRFVDRWVGFEVPADARCIWTQGLDQEAAVAMLPVAHAEGRLLAGTQEHLDQLRERGQIALRYTSTDNPNGSMDDIAGICDASGCVLGLMPHPERYTRWKHHPFWTRLPQELRHTDPPGLAMFRNAVAHARQVAV